MSIPLNKPSIRRKDMDAVLSCLVTDKIGPGTLKDQFTHEALKRLRCKIGLAMREYRRTIDLALKILDLSPSDKIILSPLAPSHYVHALLAQGLEPLYADIKAETGLMDHDLVTQLMGREPKAIILDHTQGLIPDSSFYRNLDIPLIGDISFSFGLLSDDDDKPVGSDYDLIVFSLEQDKILTTGGGAILTSQDKKYTTLIRKRGEVLHKDQFIPDMNAALGIAQLRELDDFLNKRGQIQSIFLDAVHKSRHKTFLQPESTAVVFGSFPVVLNSGMKDVRQYALKKGIETHAAFAGCSLDVHESEKGSCPVAAALLLNCLLFPLYPTLSTKDVQIVARVLSTLP